MKWLQTDRIDVDVTLRVNRIQNGNKQLDHIKTVGQLHEKNQSLYLHYEEELEEVGKVRTLIKVTDADVTIIRQGAVQMRQPFLLHKTTSGTYHSPFGLLEMETTTNELQFEWSKEKQSGQLILSYQLLLQGEDGGEHELTIYVEEAK
ncbi:DUF1934 domain-containing protein [Bacillus sp. FJAT-45350]|uniref:DUF1934 domain-containing protein n=1 Tax=Bacillus sp. FJAT-45350 TaxID=2011014 RepID=UPI000BB74F5A|nr:DUF1934 domain-containing protein [Bacillus sp. FJAT-45350]